MRLKSSSVSHDFFCSLYLRSHFRQVEMWGLEQGQESNWCRVGGGRALYSTQPSHSHTRGPGAGPTPGFRGPAFTSGRPGPRLRLSIRKMQQRALWPMLEAGNMLWGDWQYTHIAMSALRNVCTGGWLGGHIANHLTPSHGQPGRSEEATGVFMESMDKKI